MTEIVDKTTNGFDNRPFCTYTEQLKNIHFKFLHLLNHKNLNFNELVLY